MDLDALKSGLLERIDAASDVAALEEIRVSALGKKGEITAQMKQLGGLDPEARKAAGQALNALKDEIAGALDTRKAGFADAELDARLAAEAIDVSQTPRPVRRGRLHPITQTIDEIVDIFGQMGFVWAEGPRSRTTGTLPALNMPTDHPARQMQDTFYMKGHWRRRLAGAAHPHLAGAGSHDDEQTPPIRVIVPGRTFRSDSDATHTPMFHDEGW